MLDWDREPGTASMDGLWERSSDALIHPAAAVAMKLLRVTTKLDKLANVKLAPSSSEDIPPTLVPRDEDLTAAGARKLAADPPHPAKVVELHATPVPSSGLRIVDGSPEASSVILLPETPRHPSLSPDALQRMVDELGHTGALLRAAREARQIALQEMADKTRISVKYLEAIEGDDYGSLPSATFVRGYLREMSRMLGIEETTLVAGYMRRFPS